MKVSSVSVVIPNWNGRKLLEKHLPTVIGATQGAEIIVVDDYSDDDSVEFLKDTYPTIIVLKTPCHRGFSSTVNVGFKGAQGEIVILLNTDVAPEKNFLLPLLKHFTNERMFAVGCMDKSIEDGKEVLRGRGVAQWKKGFYIHNRGEVDKSSSAWVSGGAYRRAIWLKLGGMDDLFNPFYWEDIDLSYRARKAGYEITFEPKSTVYHYHEMGAIKSSISPFIVKTFAYRNQFIFIWKNLTDLKIWIEHIIYTPIRLSQALISGDNAMLIGYAKALPKLPDVIIGHIRLRALWKRSDRSLDILS